MANAPALLSSPWAASALGDGIGAEVLVFGKRLGRHPLLVFPPFAGDAAAALDALRSTEGLLNALDHPDGAVALPYGIGSAGDAAAAIRSARASNQQAVQEALAAAPPTDTLARLPHPHGPANYDADGLLARYANSLAAVAHCLGISWTTAVGYSLGGLAAAKTASLYPRLVGSLVLIDTPLVAAKDAQAHALRNDIYAARYDVNTPRAELDAAIASHAALATSPELALSIPVEADTPVYEAIFDAKETYNADKTSRDLGGFLSYEHLRALRHPVMTVLPNKSDFAKGAGATTPAEAEAMRDTFALRKALHVKAASTHADLFGAAAAETAAGLRQWVARFDMDRVMERRYNQARDRVSAALNPPEKSTAEASEKDAAKGGDATKGKKKSKKEKKAKKNAAAE